MVFRFREIHTAQLARKETSCPQHITDTVAAMVALVTGALSDGSHVLSAEPRLMPGIE